MWAHNSHLGDARYVQTNNDEFNVGQLIKEKYPLEAISIGQLTYTGEVTAADDWGGQHSSIAVNKGLPNSYEHYFHLVSEASQKNVFFLDMRDVSVRDTLTAVSPLLQRAIGVIYRPRTERRSHYFMCDIAHQFDILAWFENTTALIPLDTSEPTDPEPETYPSGL